MTRSPFLIPREITIRGKRWLVALDRDLGNDKHDVRSRMELRGRSLGVTYREHNDAIRREIHLSAQQSERALAQTFLHELMHACVPVSNAIPMAYEERFISSIERPLLLALEKLEWSK
jgi:hypothetical protein